MTIIFRTAEQKAAEVQALHRRFVHEAFEHFGVAPDDRQTYNQLDVSLMLNALAVTAAAMIVSTGERDTVKEQYERLIERNIRIHGSRSIKIPVLGNRH